MATPLSTALAISHTRVTTHTKPSMVEDADAKDRSTPRADTPCLELNVKDTGTPLLTPVQPAMSPHPTEDQLASARASYEATTIAAARHNAHANFSPDTCPSFKLSDFVKNALQRTEVDLTQLLAQQDPTFNERRAEDLHLEYNAVHFQTSSSSRIFLRNQLHYEIAFAMHKLDAATKQICAAALEIVYAVSDAQFILLINFLSCRDVRINLQEGNESNFHGTSYPVHSNVSPDIDMLDEVAIAEAKQEGTLMQPLHIRVVEDESIVKAFEMLTSDCIILRVRDLDSGEESMCHAFFREFVDRKGDLTFSTEIVYHNFDRSEGAYRQLDDD